MSVNSPNNGPVTRKMFPLCDDTALLGDYSSVIAGDTTQIKLGPQFACMENGAPDARIVNSSPGGDGK